MNLLAGLGVLIAGAAHEAVCVGWVHFSERGRPKTTALFSMLAATSEVSGILSSVHDWRMAPFYIAGFGVGTYAAVRWKSRKVT